MVLICAALPPPAPHQSQQADMHRQPYHLIAAAPEAPPKATRAATGTTRATTATTGTTATTAAASNNRNHTANSNKHRTARGDPRGIEPGTFSDMGWSWWLWCLPFKNAYKYK